MPHYRWNIVFPPEKNRNICVPPGLSHWEGGGSMMAHGGELNQVRGSLRCGEGSSFRFTILSLSPQEFSCLLCSLSAPGCWFLFSTLAPRSLKILFRFLSKPRLPLLHPLVPSPFGSLVSFLGRWPWSRPLLPPVGPANGNMVTPHAWPDAPPCLARLLGCRLGLHELGQWQQFL